MSSTDEKIMAAVQAALDENPAASVDELFERAKTVSSSVADLSKRQFHARYPLQIKRKLTPRKRRKPKKKQPTTKGKASSVGVATAHEGVRRAFLDFASELAAAEARKDVVRVVASVDKYVVEALKAAGVA